MGIRGLTTFIENFYKNHWRDVCPRGGMVFDGHSLFFSMLLFEYIDWIHGGQYWLFRQVIIDFFGSLEKSGIKPIVIMDGFTRKKEPVQISRMTDTIKCLVLCLGIEDDYPNDDATTPMLLLEVFICTMEEIGIPFYIADGEADPVTVAFANHYRCPVVGNDSDYFMFNLEYGYIPLRNLEWKTQPVRAKMYMLYDFLDIFKINNVHLSRVIPAILGNDYIDPQGLMKLLVKDGIVSTIWEYRIASIVRYISKMENVDQLVSHIRRTLENGETIAQTILKNVEQAEKIYNVTETISEEQLISNTVLVSTNNSKIPDWVISMYRRGQFSINILQGVARGMCFSRITIDCPFKSSSLLASREIREAIYAILSSLLKDDYMMELVRWENSTMLVWEKVPFSKLEFLPFHKSIPELSVESRISLIFDIIDIDSKLLESFDEHWKMVMAAGCYWVKKCVPCYDMIEALVLSFLFCSSLDSESHDFDSDDDTHSIDSDTNNNINPANVNRSDHRLDHSDADFNSVFVSTQGAKAIGNVDQMFYSDDDDSDSDSSSDSSYGFDANYQSKTIDFLKNLPNMRRTPTWMETLHKFSAFQSIYHDISKLNDVLQRPLIFVSPALIFDGKLVMIYASHIARQKCSSPLIKRLLSSVEYDTFLTALVSCLPPAADGKE